MSELFGRRVRVNVDGLQIQSQQRPGSSSWEGLRVTFNVTKTITSEPNKMSLAIYNLKRESRDRMASKDVPVVLEAGYGSEFGIVFQGDARRITHGKEGVDIVTRIEAGDGEVALRTFRINESFAPGTKYSDVLQKMLSKLGESKKIDVRKALERAKAGDFRGGLDELVSGFTVSGPAFKELDRLTKSLGLQFSVQDAEAALLGDDEASRDPILVFAPDTGLIGSPERAEKNEVKFRALLIPAVKPGMRAKLYSQAFKGTLLKLFRVGYVGDTEPSGPWFIEPSGEVNTGRGGVVGDINTSQGVAVA